MELLFSRQPVYRYCPLSDGNLYWHSPIYSMGPQNLSFIERSMYCVLNSEVLLGEVARSATLQLLSNNVSPLISAIHPTL